MLNNPLLVSVWINRSAIGLCIPEAVFFYIASRQGKIKTFEHCHLLQEKTGSFSIHLQDMI